MTRPRVGGAWAGILDAVELVEDELTDALADIIAALFTPDVAVRSKALDDQPDYGVAISLSLYTDNAATGLRRYGVQFRTRGGQDARDVDDMAEAIHQALHGSSRIPAGNSVIAHCWRVSTVSLGRDDSRRWQRSDNYLIDVSTNGSEWIET
jgi:hypothetical protein